MSQPLPLLRRFSHHHQRQLGCAPSICCGLDQACPFLRYRVRTQYMLRFGSSLPFPLLQGAHPVYAAEALLRGAAVGVVEARLVPAGAGPAGEPRGELCGGVDAGVQLLERIHVVPARDAGSAPLCCAQRGVRAVSWRARWTSMQGIARRSSTPRGMAAST